MWEIFNFFCSEEMHCMLKQRGEWKSSDAYGGFRGSIDPILNYMLNKIMTSNIYGITPISIRINSRISLQTPRIISFKLESNPWI